MQICTWIVSTISAMSARTSTLILTGLVLWVAAPPARSGDVYIFDAAQSQVGVAVSSGGVFGIFGHDHSLVARHFSGVIQYDAARLGGSSVTLSIESKSLAVLDPNASEKDRREVQATMEGPRVLNVTAFPEISFRSTGLGDLKQTGQEWEGTLTGILKLHGIERTVVFPIRVKLENDRLNAWGEVFINQREFGITPISLAGGAVRVKDRVKVTFSLLAERKKS